MAKAAILGSWGESPCDFRNGCLSPHSGGEPEAPSITARVFSLLAASIALLILTACLKALPDGSPAAPSLTAEEVTVEAARGEVPFALPREGPNPKWRKARGHFLRAYAFQLEGRLTEAIEYYRHSIKAYPTAEAHTFLGWTYSWMGRYEEAIAEAKRAISMDPDFGNPYNDIGVYLMGLGKLDEAIPWLHRAILAPRYASPHYPWMNLGHIWVLKGEWDKAASAYRQVWELMADYPVPPQLTLPAFRFLPPPPQRHPGPDAEQEKIKAALAHYYDAWNRFDATALKEVSAPPTTQEARALLMNLAVAQRLGSTLTLQQSRVLHVEEGLAVAAAELLIGGQPQELLHLLGSQGGVWRVIISLSPQAAPQPRPGSPIAELWRPPRARLLPSTTSICPLI